MAKPLFLLDRDIKFFRSIASELVDDVIHTTVTLYKLIVEESKTNIYGESLSKTYYKGVNVEAIIERDDSSITYDGFGADTDQSVEYRFNRWTLNEKGFYPEIGDIIYHNDAYFEIDNVREDQLIGGQPENRYSIICSTFMTKRSGLQIEERTS